MTRTAPAAPVHPVAGPDAGAPTVLLAHGMSDTWQSWRHLTARLPATWRLLAAELPWKAGTDHHWRRRGTPGYVARRDRRGHARAARHRGRPLARRQRGAGDASHRDVGDAARRDADRAFLLPARPADHLGGARAGPGQLVRIIDEGLRNRLGPRLATLDAATLASMRDIMVDRIGPVGFTALFDHFTATAGLPLHAVTVPTKVLTGGRDPSLDGPRASALRARLPDAEVVVEPEFHHFCHLDRAAEVARHIAVFVEQVCPDPAIRGGTP